MFVKKILIKDMVNKIPGMDEHVLKNHKDIINIGIPILDNVSRVRKSKYTPDNEIT